MTNGERPGGEKQGAARAPYPGLLTGCDVIGRVAYSKAGRDKKRPFIIVGVTDDGSVLIADAKTHAASKPKKKNLRHLIIKDAIFGGDVTDDAAIREYLKSYEDKAR